MPPQVYTLAERPDLTGQVHALDNQAWPAFMHHGQAWKCCWHHLFEDFPEYQIAITDDSGRLIGGGHTVPLTWDGSYQGLPAGWDATLEHAVNCKACGEIADALAGLSVAILPEFQGQGLSVLVLQAMKALAAKSSFSSIFVPVRPILKPLYVLTPMSRYAYWTRADGQPFDPWLCTHTKLGGQIVGISEESKVTTGTIAEWESWTQMAFPETGQYVIPGALDVLHIDRDLGRHAEPNVWLLHHVS